MYKKVLEVSNFGQFGPLRCETYFGILIRVYGASAKLESKGSVVKQDDGEQVRLEGGGRAEMVIS
jgi:hypothetical protein